MYPRKLRSFVFSLFLIAPKIALCTTVRRSELNVLSALVTGAFGRQPARAQPGEESCPAEFAGQNSMDGAEVGLEEVLSNPPQIGPALDDLRNFRSMYGRGAGILTDAPVYFHSRDFAPSLSVVKRIVGRLNSIEQDLFNNYDSVIVLGFVQHKAKEIAPFLQDISENLSGLRRGRNWFQLLNQFKLMARFRRHVRFVQQVLSAPETPPISYFGATLPSGEKLDQFFLHDKVTSQFVLVTFLRIKKDEVALPELPGTPFPAPDGFQDALHTPGVSGRGSD